MSRAFAILNARLVDPASGRDEAGGLLVENGRIVDIGPAVRGSHLTDDGFDGELIDAKGAILAPALIDLRAAIEPAFTPGGETLDTLCAAAAAGGIGTLVVAPNASLPLDTPEGLRALRHDFRPQRLRLHAAGGATRNLAGEAMSEIGLMGDAGALYVSQGDGAIADAGALRSLLAYASGFETWVALRPCDATLGADAAASESEWAARLGLAAEPAIAERMAIDRFAALAEMTGGRVIIDRLSTEEGCEALSRARRKGLEIGAMASIAHLSLNDVDAADLSGTKRLTPPLRAESDRQAMVEAIRSGLVDAVVSDHRPLPADAKARPFGDAVPGSTGVETLLGALLGLVHDGQLELIDTLRAVTSGPADLLGLPQGRLAVGAPADLALIDGDAPWVAHAQDGRSVRRNSVFEGRRFQGRVLQLFVKGAMVFAQDN
ncbi:amidohydrolase family protein [Hyphobacterium marinum]|uniref:Amidohydrolase family protein n=1 Tax=Hyphobacterium marinum TaxID=3116574 RepID=A0ABU7LZ32_9PROT|nr:amidohydrolase family protein [Hyphobacterium sp. Y6023]MEE2566817.1 amidohydrolase family protein [Hyphobacterium sp. Y6023]